MNGDVLLTILFVAGMMLAGAILTRLSHWTDEVQRELDGD